MTPIRTALIGYGLAGSTFHAPSVAAVDGLRLDAVVTRDLERRAALTRDFPATRALDVPDQVWAAADDYDLVVIATPNRSHADLARAAIDAGLGVVVDKPLAVTSAQGVELVERAQARGVLLSTYQNRRWDGDFLTLRSLVAGGRLGEVLRFESRFERWRPVPKPGWRESGAPEDAGGLLYDLCSHLVDQALVLLGPVTSVYAEVDSRRAAVQTDDDVFLALTHAGGARTHLWASAVAAQLGPRFRVLGDRAAYVCEGLDPQEAALRAGAVPGSEEWGAVPESQFGQLGAGDDLETVPTERGAYQRYYEGVVAAMREGAPAPVDPSDSVEGLRIIEAARKSSTTGAVVSL